ncbi:MAG: divalent-cation tolerance protein CutA [Limisphaerales bacterium]
MKSAAQFHIVLVTAPNRKAARHLAKSALQARLVACANLVPGIESHYWWRGRMESGAEVLIIFKTIRRHLRQLEELVLVNHPYDTPEFIVLPLTGGNARYLDWLARSVRKSPGDRAV